MADPRRPDLRDDAESDDVEKRRQLNDRLRAAIVDGDEQDSRRRLRRGSTHAEIERVLRRYPGDL